MINTIWQVCAVPLDLPGTRREPGQWCTYCQRDMMAAVQANDADLVLPDVVTSNTPPPMPLNDVFFFPPDEPCPAHAHTLTHDPHTPAMPTAPRSYLDLPQLCWDTRPEKGRRRGARGGGDDTCLVWLQVGEDLKQVADRFQQSYTPTLKDHQEPTLDPAKAIAAGLCLSLLCLVSWKLLKTH